MSVSRWGGLLVVTLSLGLMASGLSEAALADKDQRNVIAPARSGRRKGRRPRSPRRWLDSPKRSTGCNRASSSRPCRSIGPASRPSTPAKGPALWVTPTGYSALGSLLIRQVPKAAAARHDRAGGGAVADGRAAAAGSVRAGRRHRSADERALHRRRLRRDQRARPASESRRRPVDQPARRQGSGARGRDAVSELPHVLAPARGAADLYRLLRAWRLADRVGQQEDRAGRQGPAREAGGGAVAGDRRAARARAPIRNSTIRRSRSR